MKRFLAAVMIVCLLLPTMAFSENAMSEKAYKKAYEQAVSDYENGLFERALAVFEKLNSYEMSVQYMGLVLAILERENGNLAESIGILNTLGDFEAAPDWKLLLTAENLLAQKKFYEAEEAYAELALRVLSARDDKAVSAMLRDGATEGMKNVRALRFLMPEITGVRQKGKGLEIFISGYEKSDLYEITIRTDVKTFEEVITWDSGYLYTDFDGLDVTRAEITAKTVYGDLRVHTDENAEALKMWNRETPGGNYWTPECEPVSVQMEFVPEAPKSVKAEANDAEIEISWAAVDGAEKYIVTRYENGAGTVLSASETGQTYIDDTALTEVGYTYTVKACANGKESAESKGAEAKIPLKRIEFTEAKNVFGAVALEWTKGNPTDGYKVFRADENGAFSLIASVSENCYTDNTPVPGEMNVYYVSACANGTEVNSNFISVKVEIYSEEVGLTGYVTEDNTVMLSWNHFEGAKYYTVYRSENEEDRGVMLAQRNDSAYEDKHPNEKFRFYTVRVYDAQSGRYIISKPLMINVPLVNSIEKYDGEFIAEASSYRKNNKPDVSAARLVDGSLETSWDSMSEREGAWVSISVNDGEEYVITGFTIRNGKNLGPDEKVTDTDTYWHKNCRVKSVYVYVDGNFSGWYEIRDVRDAQRISLNAPLTGSTVTFRIADVYQGTKYNDTCITEIELW